MFVSGLNPVYAYAGCYATHNRSVELFKDNLFKLIVSFVGEPDFSRNDITEILELVDTIEPQNQKKYSLAFKQYEFNFKVIFLDKPIKYKSIYETE